MLAAYNRPRRVTYRVNTLKASVDEVAGAIETAQYPYSLEAICRIPAR